jgi:hypothetical protein
VRIKNAAMAAATSIGQSNLLAESTTSQPDTGRIIV